MCVFSSTNGFILYEMNAYILERNFLRVMSSSYIYIYFLFLVPAFFSSSLFAFFFLPFVSFFVCLFDFFFYLSTFFLVFILSPSFSINIAVLWTVCPSFTIVTYTVVAESKIRTTKPWYSS